jgi:pyruvate dehydrogenase E2 component (dihydrolipoamide acetyltransferase)
MGAAMSDPAGLKGTVEIVEPTPAERTIARRAAEARATVPDLELSVDVDMSRSVELGTSITALLVRASALALRENPRANGAYRDGRFELYSRVNAGLVLAGGDSATVLDADRKTLAALAAEIDELESRADDLRPAERSGATFTLARYGVTRASALITPPHAVSLAAGEVRLVAAVQVMTLTLACDHRILYGANAARVLARIRELLEHAEL